MCMTEQLMSEDAEVMKACKLLCKRFNEEHPEIVEEIGRAVEAAHKEHACGINYNRRIRRTGQAHPDLCTEVDKILFRKESKTQT